MNELEQPRDDRSRSRWIRLFADCADGVISPEDKATLVQLLANDPTARQEWYRFQDIELSLAEWASKIIAQQRAENSLPKAPTPMRPSLLTRLRNWKVVSAYLAAALCLAILVIGWRELTPTASRPSVACVIELKNERWVSADAALRVGDRLAGGQRIEISAGQAQIEFDSGALVTLIGPAIFEPTSTNSGYLLIGQLRAKTESPQSKGFEVRTRTTRVVDIGTEFVTTATADGYSHVDVTTGDVDVHVEGAETPQRLGIGDSLSVEPGARQIMARVETGDDTPAFRFPTIEPPSNRDYADKSFGRAKIQRVGGQLDAVSGPLDVLLDGAGQSAADRRYESVFFECNAPGFLQLDLGRAVDVHKINTYSWHCNKDDPEDRGRAVQKFYLYGFSGDSPPKIDDSMTDAGWVLLARVNTDETLGVLAPQFRPAQQASSISSASGSIGRYRYLLWKVLPSRNAYLDRLDHTFYGELDVYATP